MEDIAEGACRVLNHIENNGIALEPRGQVVITAKNRFEFPGLKFDRSTLGIENIATGARVLLEQYTAL